jgi:hypothetical protein
MHAAYLPDIFRDMTNLILHNSTVGHKSLLSRVKTVLENYKNWYSHWQLQLETAAMETSAFQFQFPEKTRSQVELLCCYLEHFCLIQRLLICLNPISGTEQEEVIVKAAQRILVIYDLYVKGGQPKYCIEISIFVARAILATTDRWKLSISSSETSPTIDSGTFLQWCEILGRKVD